MPESGETSTESGAQEIPETTSTSETQLVAKIEEKGLAMNPTLENTYESLTDERLDYLEQVEGGCAFFCEANDNPTRFIQNTVAEILADENHKHIVIYFRRTVALKKAKNINRRVSIAVRAADRTKKVEAIYEVPTDLFALLKQECNFGERERSAAIHAFISTLDALRQVLPVKTDMVKYLENRLNSWDREWIEEAVGFEVGQEWEIPIIVTMDATRTLKLLVEQNSRRLN